MITHDDIVLVWCLDCDDFHQIMAGEVPEKCPSCGSNNVEVEDEY